MDADGKSGRTLLIIGEDIARWRKANGYTQESFAQAVGISRRNVQDLEQGVRLAYWKEIYKLKPFMGVDDDFFATSDMIEQKPAGNKKPLDRQVNSIEREIRFWHESTPYCDEKEQDLKTLKGFIDIMIGKWRNKRK